MRRAFTLVELMLAVTVFAILTTGFASAVIGFSRMIRTAYSEAESSVRMRELRDKLLFHAAPSRSGIVWAGLLSATNAPSVQIVESGDVLLGYAGALKKSNALISTTSDQIAQDLRIIVLDNGSSRYFLNDRDRTNVQWLWPGRLSLLQKTMDNGDSLDLFDGATEKDDGWYFVRLRYDNGHGFTRTERIAVPVFGRKLTSYGVSGTFNAKGQP